MNVCFIGWQKIKTRSDGRLLKVVSVVNHVILKLFIQGTKDPSLQGAIKLAGNVLG